MSGIPLVIATMCYLWTAWEFYRQSKVTMAVVFLCYSTANICFLIELISGKGR